MTPLPSPSEVAKEITYSTEYQQYGANIVEIIKQDRSRLIQHIREKMPKKYTDEDRKRSHTEEECWAGDGWNSCIEAFEKILGEIK